jgi:hypothetical protein
MNYDAESHQTTLFGLNVEYLSPGASGENFAAKGYFRTT